MKRPASTKSGAFFFVLLLLLTSCGQQKTAKPGDILIIGDSLTAGYGLDDPETQAWPALIEKAWKDEQFLAPEQHIINAGVSGDTTEGALDRLPELLRDHTPSTVVIALGSNDIRRPGGNRIMYQNLDKMVRMAKEEGAVVLLVGVDLPTPLAIAARGEPNRTIAEVAEANGSQMATIPLDTITSDRHMLADQIHPARAGQPTIQEAIEPVLRQIVAQE